ncbi:hypothetical protein [Micavibrio aeruginosavorus]|uniref:Uncharacterized protein n=1 Tax=Micavibrio aeruginosavorus EPB TaxID=349215 RepID=M4VDH0_9BACT|nr:hypothetical protein [Micavibrio aeruginosavorus]AGH97432.1 hypothetical protein A11S_608 [Micavibrio aeruginosavorus EPB]
MQIIKVWLKITAFLAVLGWVLHWASPDFAAWLDGVFSKKDAPIVVEQGAPQTDSIPPSDAGAIRADQRADEKDDAKRIPRAPYQFNQ